MEEVVEGFLSIMWLSLKMDTVLMTYLQNGWRSKVRRQGFVPSGALVNLDCTSMIYTFGARNLGGNKRRYRAKASEMKDVQLPSGPGYFPFLFDIFRIVDTYPYTSQPW